MRIIKTMKDIELLKEASVVKVGILGEIEEHFKHIYNNLGEGIPIEEFSLVDSGVIVFLEPGDNVEDLAEIGLNPEDKGLLGTIPEWVEEETIEEGTLVTACILCNNEYALSIFFMNDSFDKEVTNWISDNI